MKILTIISALFFTAFLMSCKQEKEKVVIKKPGKTKIMEPFHFHKAIEVKPGLTLDIVSWGRGSDSTGGYLILRSDSSRLSYRSVSGELKGKIVDAWNMDLDADGNPELYIQAKSESKDNYLHMYVYEFNEHGVSQQIRFPELSSSLKEGYQGKDSLFLKEGKLIREFPFYADQDTSSKADPSIRKIEYSIRDNSLQFREIKEDKKP